MKKLKLIVTVLSFFSMLVLPCLALATTGIGSEDLGLGYGSVIGLTTQDVRVTIANIIRVALGLLGIVAVIIILYAGVIWMTAQGDKTKTDKSKKLMTEGVIGLAIILAAYAITSFVINSLVQATGGTTL